MIVHEVKVRFPVPMSGLTIEGETHVYLETVATTREFLALAQERGWKAGPVKTYVAGTLEQAVGEVEREMALFERGVVDVA